MKKVLLSGGLVNAELWPFKTRIYSITLDKIIFQVSHSSVKTSLCLRTFVKAFHCLNSTSNLW